MLGNPCSICVLFAPPPRHVEIVDFVRLWPSEGATNPTNSYKLYRSFGVCVCANSTCSRNSRRCTCSANPTPRPPVRVEFVDCVGLSPSGRVGYKLYKLCSFHRCYGLGRACRPYTLDNPCTLYEPKQLGAHPGPVWTLKTRACRGCGCRIYIQLVAFPVLGEVCNLQSPQTTDSTDPANCNIYKPYEL